MHTIRGWTLIVFFPLTLTAQSYLVHHYTEQEGLGSSEVHDALQDDKGRMWFATRAGISLYDGVTWEHFTTSVGLRADNFLKLQMDEKGRIWALPYIFSGGFRVVYYDGKHWKKTRQIKTSFTQFSRGASFRLLKRPGKDLPLVAVGTEVHGLFLYNGDTWTQLTSAQGLPGDKVNGMVALKKRLYIATDKGLSMITTDAAGNIKMDNRLNNRLGLPSKEINGIGIRYSNKYADSPLTQSRIWLFNHRWLGYFNEKDLKLKVYPVEVSFRDKHKVVRVQPDYHSGLYIGNVYRVYYFNSANPSWETVTIDNGLVSEGANSMFIDFEKNIWIPCQRGVSKIASRRFSNLQFRHGLLEDEVSAVLEYEPGRFILGHNNGVTFYDTTVAGKAKRFVTIPFFSPGDTVNPLCRVLDMHTDSRGNIWLAAAWRGLGKIDRRKRITWYGEKDGLSPNVVSLFIEKGDKLWVGTGKGIYLRTQNGFIPKNIGNVPGLGVRRMFGYSDKLRYLASLDSGLYLYLEHKKMWKHYPIPGGYKANAVYAVEQDYRGRLLIGTAAGLFVLEKEAENETVRPFHENGFGIERAVYSILQDNKQRIWFGTDNGIIRWNGKQARRFGPAEGLVGQESNRAAAVEDGKGRLWFGTNRGVSIYDERFDNNPGFNPPPYVHLLSLDVSGKSIAIDQPVRLDYKDNTLLFHFRGISFLDETAVRFKTRLQGFEEKWSNEYHPYNQMIRYTNLSPGTYRFNLKARNALGVWSPVVASPEIVISSPYYERWWFYLLLFLLLLLIIYSITRFFTQKRYAVLLEHKVEERSAQLEAVEKRYRTLFEESLDVVFVSTPQGAIIDINPAGVELFGFSSKEELLSLKSFKSLYGSTKEHKTFRETIEKNGYVKDYDLVFRRKNGEPVSTRITATLVRDEKNKIIAHRGIIRDITRQKELEQQLVQAQKMEAIGTLAGGIAHDFNNILGVIVGYTELSLDDLEKGSLLHHNISHVLTAAERASGLVKQILAFSRQSERKRIPIKLSTTIEEVLRLLRSSLPATIEIRRDIRVQSGQVMADPTQVHQVMMNLCANAAHAMGKQGGILEVGLFEAYLDPESAKRYHDIQPGNYLRLTVSDTGHGISEVVMKRIFEPYFTTKKTGEGTGMGLAVIHGIVKSHGGDITVYSEPGQGTVFNILLPRLESNIDRQEKVADDGNLSGTERILLVDDEDALARVGARMLERLGYRVTAVTEAESALQTFRSKPGLFDLVVTDLTMPRMTGIELARELKNLQPGVPIILCSGFSTIASRERLRTYGIDDFVMKPIIRNDLARVIRSLLDRIN
jgi:PAS domain S-box-containing protein